MVPPIKLTHIRLLVDDFEACFLFYRDVMGFPVLFGAPDSGYADFEAGADVKLALFDLTEQMAAVGAVPPVVGAKDSDRSLLVFQADDLVARVEELRGRGAAIVREIENHPEWGIRTAYLRDPAGNLIELNTHLDSTT